MSPHDNGGLGPTVESVDSDSTDPANVPFPDDGTGSDLDDGECWQAWFAVIRLDDDHLVSHYGDQQPHGMDSQHR